ncbi:MAG: ABC transporter ATP-binding protein [Eubacteriales bacterium]|nr:ABC transporter ATP-binding protein [Eubacteriales bacterium]
MHLQIQGIYKGFGSGSSRVEVLKNLSLNIEEGSICVLLGPSGSGKSTLLNILGGIEKPDRGSLLLEGKQLEKLTDKELLSYRKEYLGYVFQSYNLIPNLTVRENVEVGAYLSKAPLPIDEIIRLLGLWEHRDKFPNQLSGGQQQRTSIGRATVKNPSLLLCDEPTGALDYNTSKEILKLLQNINRKYGSTMVIVTHNDAISQMAHQVVRLHDGSIRSDERNPNQVDAELLEW